MLRICSAFFVRLTLFVIVVLNYSPECLLFYKPFFSDVNLPGICQSHMERLSTNCLNLKTITRFIMTNKKSYEVVVVEKSESAKRTCLSKFYQQFSLSALTT